MTWHGVKVGQPDWSSASHSLALHAEIPNEKLMFYFAFNSYWEPLEFELPYVAQRGHGPWRRFIDTGLESPADIVEWSTAEPIQGLKYSLASRSVAVFFTRLPD